MIGAPSIFKLIRKAAALARVLSLLAELRAAQAKKRKILLFSFFPGPGPSPCACGANSSPPNSIVLVALIVAHLIVLCLWHL